MRDALLEGLAFATGHEGTLASHLHDLLASALHALLLLLHEATYLFIIATSWLLRLSICATVVTILPWEGRASILLISVWPGQLKPLLWVWLSVNRDWIKRRASWVEQTRPMLRAVTEEVASTRVDNLMALMAVEDALRAAP